MSRGLVFVSSVTVTLPLVTTFWHAQCLDNFLCGYSEIYPFETCITLCKYDGNFTCLFYVCISSDSNSVTLPTQQFIIQCDQIQGGQQVHVVPSLTALNRQHLTQMLNSRYFTRFDQIHLHACPTMLSNEMLSHQHFPADFFQLAFNLFPVFFGHFLLFFAALSSLLLNAGHHTP